MRALVLRGFCKGIADYAVVGEVVDLPAALFQIMKSQGAVVEDPEPESKPDVSPEPAAEAAPTKAKGAAKR